MTDLNTILLIYFVVYISIPIIIIVHELGHALAYLWLTKPNQIDIYIGSYTKSPTDFTFKFGKIHFYVKRSLAFIKFVGLCNSHKLEENYKKHIVILLAGSVLTLFFAALVMLIILFFHAHQYLIISGYIFLGASFISLLFNLIPLKIYSFGSLLKNSIDYDTDGIQILFNLKIKNARPLYVEAINLIQNDDFEKANEKIKELIRLVPPIQKIYRLFINLFIQKKQFEAGEYYLIEMEKQFELTANDLTQKGYFLSVAKKHDEAIEAYTLALKKHKNHIYALNNIGYELIEKGAHQVAARALEKAIKKQPTFSYPYSNLGYSKILQGSLEDGKVYIDKSLLLDKHNATAYKYMGIYYIKKEDTEMAKISFAKAKELDADIELDEHEIYLLD